MTHPPAAPPTPPAARDPQRRHAGDRGSTLVEIVIAITLLAVIVVPVLAGLTMATKASAVSRAASNVETALINAVDRVNRSDAETHSLCDYHPYARAAVVTQGWSPSEVTTRTEYLDLASGSWVQGPPTAEGCPGGLYHAGLIQRVTITVTDPDRHVSRSIQVVKSNV